jgi:hypothetical protein
MYKKLLQINLRKELTIQYGLSRGGGPTKLIFCIDVVFKAICGGAVGLWSSRPPLAGEQHCHGLKSSFLTDQLGCDLQGQIYRRNIFAKRVFIELTCYCTLESFYFCDYFFSDELHPFCSGHLCTGDHGEPGAHVPGSRHHGHR